jgi:hypothetical protein
VGIRKLRPSDDPRACQMIFVSTSDKRVAEKIVAAVRGSSTLTIGETKGFAGLGGIINLTTEGNRLSFEINVDAARQTRLEISSNLLSLAKIVKSKQ